MNADVLIIGSGIAALQLAKKIAKDKHVIILTKSKLTHCNSYLAQGGIAASLDEGDTYRKHALDTIEAGRFHNNTEVVAKITEEAPALIQSLSYAGCAFDMDDQGFFQLGMEGAHSEKRIVHAGGDATGKQVIEFLAQTQNQNITIIEHIFVYELLVNSTTNQCFGVKGIYEDGRRENFYSRHTVLATGGCGQLYTYTTSDARITGDGISLAYLAGAKVTDMEFMQFHPTLLYVNGKTIGLVSEAVRGEGAKLVTKSGHYIMENIHLLKDLAPRHIVSQEIYAYLAKGEAVFLDITSIHNFETRFPTITRMCVENGISLEQKRIPVAPGSHFLMGGVQTDLYGRTSIDNLYAIGEVACTGFHGANRLASNSLLEGLYMGEKLSKLLNAIPTVREPIPKRKIEENRSFFYPHFPTKKELQAMMMENVGIIRKEEKLNQQLQWLEGFGIQEGFTVLPFTYLQKQDMEIFFMLVTAYLITAAALKRTESRGGHYRSDYPKEETSWLKERIVQQRKRRKDKWDESTKIAKTT